MKFNSPQQNTYIVEDWRTGQLGLVQHFNNKAIEKIEWFGTSFKVGTNIIRVNNGKLLEVDEHEFRGTCTIHYRAKPPKEFDNSIIDFDTLHGSSYGMPISNDGKKLFVGSWYKVEDGVKKGLRAYDTETGALLWRLNEGKIRHIFVYDDYLIVLQAYSAVLKVDINSGEVLGRLKSRDAEKIFDLGTPSFILLDLNASRLRVVDTEKMQIVKKYSPSITDPSNCVFSFERAELRDNTLIVSGFEQPPDMDFEPDDPRGIPFERVIDTDFYTM